MCKKLNDADKQDSINGSLLKKFIVVYLNTPSRSFQFARRPNNIEIKLNNNH